MKRKEEDFVNDNLFGIFYFLDHHGTRAQQLACPRHPVPRSAASDSDGRPARRSSSASALRQRAARSSQLSGRRRPLTPGDVDPMRGLPLCRVMRRPSAAASTMAAPRRGS